MPAQTTVPLNPGLHAEIMLLINPTIVSQCAIVGATSVIGVVDAHSSGGRIVGELEGAAVGVVVGANVGSALGDTVGAPVGTAVGTVVGVTVGVAVGLAVTNFKVTRTVW